MKKTVTYFILTAIMHILTIVFMIWAIVEFLLYLVKDDPFDWRSVIGIVIFLILEIIFGLKMVFSDDY